MPQISVTVRSFSLKIPRKKHAKYYDLTHPILSWANSGELFRELIRTYPDYKTEEEKEYAFRFEEIESNLDRHDDHPYYYVFGRIHTGQYGREGDVVDTTTGKVDFKMQPKHAEIRPFDFVILVQKKPNDHEKFVHKGLMLFEINGGNSARYQFMKILKGFLKSRVIVYNEAHKDNPKKISLEEGPVMNSEAMEAIWNNSQLAKIILVKNEGSIDNSDFRRAKEKRVYSNIVLKHAKFEALRKKFITGGVIELVTEDGFDYDEVKVVMKDRQGRERTFKMGNMDKIQVSELMPQEMVGRDGYPIAKDALPFYCETGMSYMERMAIEIR